MRIADMHVHSIFSPDGISTMEEQCREAVNKGLSFICFTDHVDFNSVEYNMGTTKDNRKQNFDVDEYLTKIECMKKLFPQIEILSGIEFSEPHLFAEEFATYLNKPFDYVLGSIHHCNNGIFPGVMNLSESQAVREYYSLMIASLDQCTFQGIAHIDFPRPFFDSWNIDDKTISRILELIISKKVALEINTSLLQKNGGDLMPSVAILKKYIEMGGRRVVLGSDAHKFDRIAFGFENIISTWGGLLDFGYIKGREFYSL